MLERPLQARLHLHVPELGDREVELLEGCGPFLGVVLEQQFSELQSGEGELWSVTDPGTELEGLLVIRPSMLQLAQEHRSRAEMAADAGEVLMDGSRSEVAKGSNSFAAASRSSRSVAISRKNDSAPTSMSAHGPADDMKSRRPSCASSVFPAVASTRARRLRDLRSPRALVTGAAA